MAGAVCDVSSGALGNLIVGEPNPLSKRKNSLCTVLLDTVPRCTHLASMQKVGDRVRALRGLLGLSQDALAARCGLVRTDIVKIETGRNNVSSFAKRKALALGFGLSDEHLANLLAGILSPTKARALVRASSSAQLDNTATVG